MLVEAEVLHIAQVQLLALGVQVVAVLEQGTLLRLLQEPLILAVAAAVLAMAQPTVPTEVQA
jgi:hypothetical protein